LRVDFDQRLKLEFHGSKITTDGGMLVYRELDEALGLTEVAGDVFQDNRTGKNGWLQSKIPSICGQTGLQLPPVEGYMRNVDLNTDFH